MPFSFFLLEAGGGGAVEVRSFGCRVWGALTN